MTNTQPPTQEVREAWAKIIAASVAFRHWDYMAEDRADLRLKVREGNYDVNEPTKDDCRDAANNCLALFPPPAGVVEALRELIELYDEDEGCRSLPQIIRARQALSALEGMGASQAQDQPSAATPNGDPQPSPCSQEK